MEIKERLKRLAKSRDIDLEDVKAQFEEIKEDTGFEGKKAWNVLVSKLREKPKIDTGATIGNFLGFKVGDVGLFDYAEIMRNVAERTWEQDGFDEAKRQGLINDDGEVLDTRKTIFGSQKNPDYGEPLGEDTHIRRHSLFMIVKQAGKKKWRFARVSTFDNTLALAWCDLPFRTWVTFPAIIKGGGSGGQLMLRGSTAKDTTTIFKQVKEDRDTWDLFEKVMKPQVTKVRKVEGYHESVKGSWDRWILCYGIVSSLNLERDTPFGMPGRLIDAEEGWSKENQVRFFIPDYLNVDFGPYSEVYLLGQTRRAKYRDRATGELKDADVVIDMYGAYPNPELLITRDDAEEAVGAEEEIKGFLKLED